MKRIIMMVLRNLPFIPMAWFKLCWYASHVDNYTEGERYALLKMIDRRTEAIFMDIIIESAAPAVAPTITE